jgi:hypothetical protein
VPAAERDLPTARLARWPGRAAERGVDVPGLFCYPCARFKPYVAVADTLQVPDRVTSTVSRKTLQRPRN